MRGRAWQDGPVRVLVAPDKFAGTLTAVEAAEAIAAGWRERAPHDDVVTVPMSDGGPGFVDVLHAAFGGRLLAVTVRGPLGEPTPASCLVVGDTAYVESSQACGLHLVPPAQRDPDRASTYGVGELIAAVIEAGARRVLIGLGGSGTNDGGAGMLAALGVRATPADALTGGAVPLAGLESLDLEPARERVAGVELLAASDVDNPLLGLRGATNVFGPQKGVPQERLTTLDAALEQLSKVAAPDLAEQRGAGAAGGLGYGLLLLGGTRLPGIETVIDAVGLREHAAAADLVLTGEGKFDFQSKSGKVVSGVAEVAGSAIKPCVVLAGDVQVGTREMRAMGVDSAYSMIEAVGTDAAFDRPDASLRELAARVARTWSH